jgi:hypothetical protein
MGHIHILAIGARATVRLAQLLGTDRGFVLQGRSWYFDNISFPNFYLKMRTSCRAQRADPERAGITPCIIVHQSPCAHPWDTGHWPAIASWGHRNLTLWCMREHVGWTRIQRRRLSASSAGSGHYHNGLTHALAQTATRSMRQNTACHHNGHQVKSKPHKQHAIMDAARSAPPL